MLEYLLYLSLKIEPIFYKIIYMSIIASFIGIVILIVRKVLKNKLSPTWISRIWFVFIISLLIPIQIKSPISIYNYIQINEDSITYEIEEFIKSEDELFAKSVKQNSLEVNSETKDIYRNDNINYLENSVNIKNVYTIRQFIPVIWGIIVITTIFAYILTYIAFEFKIRKYKYENDKIEKILDFCKEKLNIKTEIKIIKQDIIKMPALFGIFNKRILLSDNILELSEEEQKYIFIHELSHYKRKDNILNVLITILRVTYFFNPIIWISLSAVKNDLELATDEFAMKNENKESQKEYSKTLVKLSVINSDKFLIQTICMSEGKKILERRIDNMKLIEKFKENKKNIGVFAVIIILLLGSMFLTQNKNYINYEEFIKLAENAIKIDNVYIEYQYTINGKKYENIEKIYYKDGIQRKFTEIKDTNVYDIDSGEIIDKKIDNIEYFYDFNNLEIITIDYTNKEMSINSLNEKYTPSFVEYIENIKNILSMEYEYKFEGIENIKNRECYKIAFYNNDYYFKYWMDIENSVIQKQEFLSEDPNNNSTNNMHVICEYKYDFNVVTEENVRLPQNLKLIK